MRRVIYIAGKVTGVDPIVCAAKFASMERQIKAKGHIVVNPITLVNDPNCDWFKAMDICLDALRTCDTIFMLPCSTDSKGAQRELDTAIQLNIDIFTDIKDIKNAVNTNYVHSQE
jgi:hypothetical protein